MQELDIPIQIVIWFIASSAGIGVLMAGFGYGYGQFKRGRKLVDEETIQSLQRQLDILNREMAEVKKENKDYVAINNQLQGQVKTYKEVATLQNPEVKELLTKLAETVPLLVQSIQYCQSKQVKSGV